eukprot:303852-Rhodomonas_salina.10
MPCPALTWQMGRAAREGSSPCTSRTTPWYSPSAITYAVPGTDVVYAATGACACWGPRRPLAALPAPGPPRQGAAQDEGPGRTGAAGQHS